MLPPLCLQKGLEIHIHTSNLSGEGLENLGTLCGLHLHPCKGSAFQSSIPKTETVSLFFHNLFSRQSCTSGTGKEKCDRRVGVSFAAVKLSRGMGEGSKPRFSRALWLQGGRVRQGTEVSLSFGSCNAGENAGGRRRGQEAG